MDVPITYLGRSHRRDTFTVGIEKQALIPSFILSSLNHTTSSRTVQPKPLFYSANMNKVSLSPQKQLFTTLLPFRIPRSTVNIKTNNNNHFLLVMAAWIEAPTWQKLISLMWILNSSCISSALKIHVPKTEIKKSQDQEFQIWAKHCCKNSSNLNFHITSIFETSPWIHSCFFFLSEALISKVLSRHFMRKRHFFPSLSGKA